VLLFAVAVLGTSSARALTAQQPRQIEDLRAQARRDSCDPRAVYDLGLALLSQRRFEAADSAFALAIAVDPSFAPAYLALGIAQDPNRHYWDQLRHRGDTALVRELRRREGFFRKALMLDPIVDFSALFGTAAYRFAEYAYAYGASRRSIDSLPPRLLWLSAIAAARSGREQQAIVNVEALVRQTLARERSDSTRVVPLHTNDFRYLLAALHQRVAENTLAIGLYEQVIENDIGFYMAHVQLARIHEREKDWFNAVRQRRLAVEINPEDPTLYYDLGATLSLAERWPEAEEALLRARDMKPCYVPTYLALGIAEQRLGKTQEARASLTTFLAIAPSRQEAQIAEARQRLASLQ
jgi:tetratricopeptide (TPR) repeat protein